MTRAMTDEERLREIAERIADAYIKPNEVQWRTELADDITSALAAEYRRGMEAAQKLPAEPSLGLLTSMAFRYDHGLMMPGYYDQEMFADKKLDGTRFTHADRFEGTLRQMSQLYEEVSGRGFYRPEREQSYCESAAAIRAAMTSEEK